MESLSDLYTLLNLNENNGLFITKDEAWKKDTAFPNRVKRLIERKIIPEAFFCFDNKPLILFFSNPENKKKLHKDIWNFNECPIIIIFDAGSIEIFNGFNYLKEQGQLEKFGGIEKLNDFNYFELVTGTTWEKYENYLNYKNRIDYHLLNNIKAARKLLVEKHKLDAKIANALIGKSIFVRYLIDRGVKMKFDEKLRTWSNNEFCELLSSPRRTKAFFDYLENNEKGFKGDLFPLKDDEFSKISNDDFQAIRRLLQGEDIERNQPSLFELYDFSIIPIEFISNVYELFIGEDNQKKEGAFYTPLFLVDYILKETVEKYLNNQSTNFSCKVLDPACGSGIFLVEALRKIIEKYIELNPELDTKSDKFKKAIKDLAKNNLFGIDKDPSAVQVAIFSVYLTLLDYLEPPGIETFTFPTLLSTNFFIADFFDVDLSFNDDLKKIDFNFIVGNPPWFRGKGEKSKPKYIEYIQRRKKASDDVPQIEIGNKEIAQAFLLRTSDFSKTNTINALIVTSKVLYNLQSAGFRTYFLHNFFIKRVLELAAVRREVFEKSNKDAIAPAAVLFFNYAFNQTTNESIIEHISLKPNRFFSLFKIFSINRSDFKKIQQSKLKEFDWLWKTLVYGSYLDFNFLKRLKNDYESVNAFLSANKALVKQGIKRKDGNKKINVDQLLGWSFLDLNKKEIQQFYIEPYHEKWDLNEVGYVYKENNQVCLDVFSPPVLLVKETVNTKLESVSAVSFEKIVFTDKVTSIKLRDSKDIDNYYLIAGLFNSSLFAYYILNSSSTAGIMIEQQIHDFERFSFPFIKIDSIITITKAIEKLKTELYSGIMLDQTILNEIKNKERSLNEFIYEAFKLSDYERSLVEYATDITIPVIMKHKSHQNIFKAIPINHSYLKQYANLFIERFKKLNSEKMRFVVEIWHSNQIIGMLFKMIAIEDYSNDIVFIDKQNDNNGLLALLIKITSQKVTDQLFIQKEIRGVEKKDFFIFKPNEKRLWHKSIGYSDVNEFANAILKAGRDSK